MPLVVDIESKSLCSIKDAGAWAYSLHPSTEVMCMVGMDTDTGEIRRVDLRCSTTGDEVEWFNSYKVRVAHNIAFEKAIFENTLGWDMSRITWIDTMDIAAYMGAPLSLGGSAEFLLGDQDAVQKDKDGRKLMLKICTPSNKKKGTFSKYTEEDFEGLVDYCEQDVRVSAALYTQFKDYVPASEWEVIADTQRMNARGIPVDMKLVDLLLDYYQDACDSLEVPEGYEIEDVRSNAKMLEALAPFGMENVQAETVQDLLDSGIEGDERLLLEGRQIMTMSSIKKLNKLQMWCGEEESFKNGFQYHGAKTGRYAGRGPQPQNLARGYDNDLDIVMGRLAVGAKI